MTTRASVPAGAPCWVDLWTSDVEGTRRFYGELFGWESQDPNPDFGGYFNFTRDGALIAGAMGDMGTKGDEHFLPANDTWKIYFATNDIHATVAAAEAAGATMRTPAMPVADLGWQAVLNDATGVGLGLWQPGTHPGITVLEEPGAPSWFELLTSRYDDALAFYRHTFDWTTQTEGDTDDFRYSTVLDAGGNGQLAGVMDASGFLSAGDPGSWWTYWHVDDMDAAVAKVQALGGTVVMGPESTPYGRLAEVADPAGAHFKLRTPPTA